MFTKLKHILKRDTKDTSKQDALSKLNDGDCNLVQGVKSKRLTYLTDSKIGSIISTIREIEAKGVQGTFLEAGCALGGSAIIMGKIKDERRLQKVYDVFGMIPPPTKEDTKDVHERYKIIAEGKSLGIGGDTYYGYEENLYNRVIRNFELFGIDLEQKNIELIEGLVQDTLVLKEPIAFAHIDVDWYEPVMTCLERIYPQLVVNGSIILDDYHDWGGCRKATDEFLRTVVGTFALDDSAGSMKIEKVKT